MVDLKDTLAKSKKLLHTIETSLREFILDLETKLKVDYQQLEKAQREAHNKDCKHTSEVDSTAAPKKRETTNSTSEPEPAPGNTISSPGTVPTTTTPTTSSPSSTSTASTTTPTTTTTSAPTTTAPSHLCAKLVRKDNTVEQVNIPNWPTNVAGEHNFSQPDAFKIDREITKMVVQPGCMATVWLLADSDGIYHGQVPEIRELRNVEQGEYEVKSLAAGTALAANYKNSFSRVECMCDPLRVDPGLKQENCLRNHKFNERTQRCEWSLEYNVCGELITADDTKQLKIPNWPISKRHDVNYEQIGLKQFLGKVTSIIVRNGCFLTMYAGSTLDTAKAFNTHGYGEYKSIDAAKATRVVCECMNDDSNRDKIVVDTPEPPKCLESHSFNATTQLCDWIVTKSCIEVTKKTDTNRKEYLGMIGSGGYEYFDENMYEWNNQALKITVRRGCMASFYSTNSMRTDFEIAILENVEYGEYEIDSIETGTAPGGVEKAGFNRYTCFCDPTKTFLDFPYVPVPMPNHVLDKATGYYEWTLAKNICGEIENRDGERMQLVIPNWPHNKRYDVNLVQAKLDKFARRVASITVRAHCVGRLLPDASLNGAMDYDTGKKSFKIYGKHTVRNFSGLHHKREAERVVCECMY